MLPKGLLEAGCSSIAVPHAGSRLALASTDLKATEAQCFLLLHGPTGNHR